MTIAFWNINNNTELAEVLIDLVNENDIDILFLAEAQKSKKNKRKCTIDDILLDFIIKSKKGKLSRVFEIIPNNDFRVKVISSISPSAFHLQDDMFKSSRWSAFLLNIPGVIKMNLFPVHFYSKVNWSDSSLALECVNFSRDIAIVENKTSCSNSILIGDFNMNPFEHGLVASNGIHALKDLDYLAATSEGRKIDGTYYRYFYNPMWNFLGDSTVPYGTIYHRVSGHISHEWHLYDQIIVRPELKQHLPVNAVTIVTQIGGKSILKKHNRPDESYSDHLPIMIKLTI